jgi:hypothetical protein
MDNGQQYFHNFIKICRPITRKVTITEISLHRPNILGLHVSKPEALSSIMYTCYVSSTQRAKNGSISRILHMWPYVSSL